jgi:hypothetical protein
MVPFHISYRRVRVELLSGTPVFNAILCAPMPADYQAFARFGSKYRGPDEPSSKVRSYGLLYSSLW